MKEARSLRYTRRKSGMKRKRKRSLSKKIAENIVHLRSNTSPARRNRVCPVFEISQFVNLPFQR